MGRGPWLMNSEGILRLVEYLIVREKADAVVTTIAALAERITILVPALVHQPVMAGAFFPRLSALNGRLFLSALSTVTRDDFAASAAYLAGLETIVADLASINHVTEVAFRELAKCLRTLGTGTSGSHFLNGQEKGPVAPLFSAGNQTH